MGIDDHHRRPAAQRAETAGRALREAGALAGAVTAEHLNHPEIAELGLTVRAVHTAVDLYKNREAIAEEAAKAGREVGKAMGEAVRQVYGDQLDPVTEMKIRDAIERMERHEQREQRARPAQAERPPAAPERDR